MEVFIRVGRSLSRSRRSYVLIRNTLGLSKEIRESLLILMYKENQDCVMSINIEMLSIFSADLFIFRNVMF